MKHLAHRIALPALLATIALVAPRAARADARLASLPAEMRSGETVTLAWSGAADAEEAELLLSLDDGRHWTVRVSPEMDARAQRFVWHVPDLGTASARIGLRVGSKGNERMVAMTAPFCIVAAHRNDPATMGRSTPMVVEGTLWSGFAPAPGPLASSLMPGTPRYEVAFASSPAERPVSGRMRFTLRGAGTRVSAALRAAHPKAAPGGSAPLEVPLRV